MSLVYIIVKLHNNKNKRLKQVGNKCNSLSITILQPRGDMCEYSGGSLLATGVRGQGGMTVKPVSPLRIFSPESFYCYTNASHRFLPIDLSNSLEQSIHPFTRRSSEPRPNRKCHQVYILHYQRLRSSRSHGVT